MNNNDLHLMKVVENAESYASGRGSTLVTTIDLMAGIILFADSFAKEILDKFDINIQDIDSSAPQFSKSSNKEYTFTPLVDEILFETYEIAEKLKHKNVSADHLLISILTYDTGYVKHFLQTKNIDPFDITNTILNYYGESPEVNEFRESLFKSSNTQDSLFEIRSTKFLDELCTNMNQEAKKGKYTEAFTRESKIDEMTNIISRRTKNNVCLIGEPGVGKTAIVEGFVNKIVNGRVVENLKNKKIYSVNMGIIISGTKYRGEFEERIQNIVKEASENQDIILFIDEIHTLVGTGGGESSLDAANILKPALARGDIQVIGATTYAEYKKFIEKDGALERRFKPVRINEPSVEETEKILENLIPTYENFHNVELSNELCKLIAKLSDRYINDRFLPDKAIDLLDEACVNAKNAKHTDNDYDGDNSIIDFLTSVVNEDNGDEALSENISKIWNDSKDEPWKDFIRREYYIANKSESDEKVRANIEVTAQDVYDVLYNWTGIPARRFNNDNNHELMTLEERLNKKVIGQPEVVNKVVRAIKRSSIGISNKNKPIGSFLFCGNTGVGKTYLAKVLSEEFFYSDKNLITVDMTEYMEAHSVSKLIGSPPGYVGYDEKGQLTEKVRKNPYSVVLFDEIEKAHPDIFNILLRILDEGNISDSSGRNINFKNTIIIMTSNIGSQALNNKGALGFGEDSGSTNRNTEIIRQSIKQKFKPEFINRLDDIIIFNKLNEKDLILIINQSVENLKERIYSELGIQFSFDDDVVEFILKKNTNANYGAREINRLIQSNLEDKISDFIISYPKVKHISCKIEKNEIILKRDAGNGKKN